MAFRFQKSFSLERRHASRARGGNGLPVSAVLNITGVEDALDAGPRATVRNEVTFCI